MKASDLREKNLPDLLEMSKSLTSDMFQNRLKNFTNRLDDTSAVRKSRRDRARVLTLIREVELRTGVTAAATAPAAKAEGAEPAPVKAKRAPKKKAEAEAEGEATATASPKKSSKKSEASSR
jgi:large subunit ribosomal protein L29